MEHVELVLLFLLVTVAALTLLARVLGVPYPILLVLGGTLVGFAPGVPEIELDHRDRARAADDLRGGGRRARRDRRPAVGGGVRARCDRLADRSARGDGDRAPARRPAAAHGAHRGREPR